MYIYIYICIYVYTCTSCMPSPLTPFTSGAGALAIINDSNSYNNSYH